ncbi:S-layer protein domain-containing protein [Methanosarcina sp. T3]|uniref:S-layer protein domain-containing protein n=1 Tax=Methanosarcina sp. T3 TaxID=3439062 RepID=UPI003F8315D4
MLIDGDEIYVRSGNYHGFLQDYRIYVKGADTEGSRIWIELSREGVFLEDAIVGEGGTFVYSNNSTEIFNLTVDTIYAGTDGVLVRFSPVYQYLNPRLPMPQNPETPPANSSENNSSVSPVPEHQVKGFDMPLFLLSIGVVFLVTGFFAERYKKK